MTNTMTRVAFQRRVETQRRLEAIKKFERDPSRAHAKLIAAETGLSISLVYTLATAGRETGVPRPSAGPSGQAAAVARHDEQRLAVLDALASDPDATVSEIIARSRDLAAQRGLTLPTAPTTIRKIIIDQRAGKLPVGSPFVGADFACLRCAIEVPVANAGAHPSMPIATLVIDLAAVPPAVLGLSLSIDPPGAPPTARALLDAMLSQQYGGAPGPCKIAIMALEAEDTRVISAALAHEGHTLRTAIPKPFNGNDVVALLGLRPAGLVLKPGLVTADALRRRAHLPAGASPLTLVDATAFVRERLLDAFPPNRGILSSWDGMGAAIKKLAAIAAS